MEKKLTNKMALEFVLSLEEVKSNVEIFDKLSKMLEQVEKKNSTKSDKLTKTQSENVEISDAILLVMSELGKPCQIKELVAILGYSSQKLSALVRQMVSSGIICRTEVKKVAYFSIIE